MIQGGGEAGVQIHLGRPSGQRLGFAVVTDQFGNFAARRTHPLRLLLSLQRTAQERPTRSTSSLTETPRPTPRLIVSPTARGDRAAARNPRAVSETKVRSRTGLKLPNFTTSFSNAWEMIVGMTARWLCRGP